MSAANLIRQHLEALPDWHRGHWEWHPEDGELDSAGGAAVVSLRTFGEPNPTMAYIALLASPHVAEALAELLEARAARKAMRGDYAGLSHRQLYERLEEQHAADLAIRRAFDALEAAISREGRST